VQLWFLSSERIYYNGKDFRERSMIKEIVLLSKRRVFSIKKKSMTQGAGS